MELQRRFFALPRQRFFLFGPRGRGKSTWLRHVFPEAAIVDLLDPLTSRELSAKPERLRDIVAGTASRSTVIIDEVMAAELDRFNLQSALTYGLLPLVVASERPEDVLRAY